MNHECAISISHDNVNRRVLFCFVLLDTAEDQFPYNYFRWRVLDEWKRLYGCGGGKIVHCAEPASKCRSACAGHSGQKLLPVVVRRVLNQIHRVRVVTESNKHGIHVSKVPCYLSYGAHETVY